MENLPEQTQITPNEIILHDNVPLAKSKLWDYQRDYYLKNGINAWNKVPYYITSNPYIADSYANIIIRFLQDCKKNKSIDTDLPFYIVELGAGSGTFSFHFINRFFELKKLLSVNTPVVYIMTDLVQDNIDFWRSHKSFQPFIAAGHLDFACFDAEYSKKLHLLNSGITLQPEETNQKKNPFVFIANYCFDSLKSDVFLVKDDRIFEGLCKLSTPYSNIENNVIRQLDKVKISFSFPEAQLPYYHFDFLNELLLHYKISVSNQYVSFPAGSLVCIQNLRVLSGNRLLLISSDKGYSKHLEVYQKEIPSAVFHDNCFSLSVNFDAIKQYFKFSGGDSFTQFTEQSLTTCAFMSGFKFADMPETALALETSLNTFGHSTINNLFLNYRTPSTLTSIETIMPFLGASKWDPIAFNSCRIIIIKQMKAGYARVSDIEDLKEKVNEIERNFYMMPNAVDTFFDIGIFLQEAKTYEQALEFYQKSILHFGEKDKTLYNMGLCHYFLKRPQDAITKFSEALNHNPKYVLARGWISQIESEYQLTEEKTFTAQKQ